MMSRKRGQSDWLTMPVLCLNRRGGGVNAGQPNASNERRKMKTKTGFTCGAFDLLHAGHAQMLEECKTVCDYLIVGVHSDPTIDRPEKNKPVQSLSERVAMVRAIRWVDEVITYDTEDALLEILRSRPLDVRIMGADWRGRNYTGEGLPIEIYFNSRGHTYSTSELRQRVFIAELENRLRNSTSVRNGVQRSSHDALA
jgi:glycerol-3-phosphate cytidylyltransferase